MPEWHRTVEHMPVLDFIDANLRGIGQVVFMNNPVTGLLILAAMYVASPWLGLAVTIQVVVSTVTALLLGFDRDAIRAGLYSFNGVLVGAALATFLQGAFSPAVIGYIVVISAFSTVLMAALSKAFLTGWTVPPFTLPFNFATLIFLFSALNWAHVRFVRRSNRACLRWARSRLALRGVSIRWPVPFCAGSASSFSPTASGAGC